ncbi:hypothetical protein PCLA_12r0076 [Pseudomonas citronellolis]|nr:hypothetical protein PCLA_12r0076 [Pseudomonas citronellolis]
MKALDGHVFDGWSRNCHCFPRFRFPGSRSARPAAEVASRPAGTHRCGFRSARRESRCAANLGRTFPGK